MSRVETLLKEATEDYNATETETENATFENMSPKEEIGHNMSTGEETVTNMIPGNNAIKNIVVRNETKMEAQLRRLTADVENLKKLAKTMNCEFQPEEICGPCTCVDERRLPQKYYCDCRNIPAKEDCLEFRQNEYDIDGIYTVHQNNYKQIDVYCDQTTDNGGWTVFQRRFDGTESFHRDWEMYKNGFGDLQFEHWLGNEHLHTIMLHSLYYGGSELRVELMDWDRKPKYAHYGQFSVGNEFAKYEMHVGKYSGTAGDAFSAHNKMDFSTIDKDNDMYGGSCAQKFGGGWWYANTDCLGGAALNQHYYQYGVGRTDWFGIRWKGMSSPTQKSSLKRTEMKIRRYMGITN